jgi:transitional endoplasmic reticulum ATPase
MSDDGFTIFLEFRNGQTATVDDCPFECSVGDVFLVRPQENYMEPAPEGLWPQETWIGTVKLKLADVTIIERGGQLRKVPSRDDLDYQEGNTVEASDLDGVVRVLTETPIRYLDTLLETISIERFRTTHNFDKGYEHFGGYKEVVERAKQLIEVPLKYRESLARIGAKPIKGVLLTGPPGTGKTLLARIIASRAGAQFYEVSGPEIFSKWYGQSEEVLRTIFDEIDSVATQRSDETHEASRRVVAQLLTLMDGFTPSDNIVVIATTNRPQDIDVALRRPGRFDWEIEFGLPSFEDRQEILRASSSGLRVDGALPHAAIAAETEGWSSADLAAIWTEAAMIAVIDERDVLVAEDYFAGFLRVSEQKVALSAIPGRGTGK